MEQISLTQRADYNLLYKLIRSLLVVTVILVFLPLNPAMPRTGGDYSWMFGMNVAQAEHMVFGKDIIFTLGPYAAVYTKVYHPGTDGLMLFSGLVLALFNVVLLYKLTKGRTIVWHVLFIGFFAGGFFSRDVLLFLYPILLSLYIYQTTGPKETGLPQSFSQKITYAFLFIPFGLLILVKGSMLVLEFGIMGLCSLLFLKRKMKKLAFAIWAIFLISTVFFTLIARQPLYGLWYYLKGIALFNSGYTEAMFINGPNSELIIFVLSCMVMLYFCYKTKNTTKESRLFLTLAVGLYLFTAFKGGFTRQDSHVLTSGVAICVLAFLLHAIISHKYLFISSILAAFTWAFLCYGYVGNVIFDVFKPVPLIYTESFDGLVKRIGGKDAFKQAYFNRLAEIRNNEKPSIPILEGTTDLYSYEQSYLLATENKWSPRPIFQSYGVYNEQFARLNEAHLVSPSAPNNIIYRMGTIDYRMPALDDGLSWPTIINNYVPGNIDVGFMYLKQKRSQNKRPKKTVLYTKSCKLHEEVIMPDTSQVLFAEFDIKPTFLGSVITGLYQPDPLTIFLTFTDGNTKHYRFIPIMSKSGLIFSPLIESVEEFGFLFNYTGQLKHKAIKSFKITNDGMGFRSKFNSWKTEYTIQLSKFDYDK